MRFSLLLAVLAACGETSPTTTGDHPLPDAQLCLSGEFQIVAPVQAEHYDPDLVVLIDFAELDPGLGDATLTMVDDAGTPYTATSMTDAPGPNPPFYRWRFDYTLAPGHRYELTVTPADPLCDGTGAQTVTFFTSSP